MASLRQGSFHLFRFAGVDLFLHWSWFLVAAFEISDRAKRYPSLSWNVLEYIALFLIVMLHEYGHALACRQVGGTANRIVLWPLGGLAYVNPPPTAGPYSLEHRRGAAGEFGAPHNLVGTWRAESIAGVGGDDA